MDEFRTTLISGKKRPYASWTFLVVPPELAAAWGPGSKAVRGTIAGAPFRGTASRGEGVVRMSVPSELREAADVRCGDTVAVCLELDPEPRTVEVPDELRTVFDEEPDVAALYAQLPPAHRRAWAAYVGEAKRPETRLRRARKAPEGIRERAFPR